jgi:hypothetical protein
MTPQLRKFFQAIGKAGGKKTAAKMSPEAKAASLEGGHGAGEGAEEGLAALRVPFFLRVGTRRRPGAGVMVRDFRRLLAASRRGLYMSVGYESENPG